MPANPETRLKDLFLRSGNSDFDRWTDCDSKAIHISSFIMNTQGNAVYFHAHWMDTVNGKKLIAEIKEIYPMASLEREYLEANDDVVIHTDPWIGTNKWIFHSQRSLESRTIAFIFYPQLDTKKGYIGAMSGEIKKVLVEMCSLASLETEYGHPLETDCLCNWCNNQLRLKEMFELVEEVRKSLIEKGSLSMTDYNYLIGASNPRICSAFVRAGHLGTDPSEVEDTILFCLLWSTLPEALLDIYLEICAENEDRPSDVKSLGLWYLTLARNFTTEKWDGVTCVNRDRWIGMNYIEFIKNTRGIHLGISVQSIRVPARKTDVSGTEEIQTLSKIMENLSVAETKTYHEKAEEEAEWSETRRLKRFQADVDTRRTALQLSGSQGGWSESADSFMGTIRRRLRSRRPQKSMLQQEFDRRNQ